MVSALRGIIVQKDYQPDALGHQLEATMTDKSQDNNRIFPVEKLVYLLWSKRDAHAVRSDLRESLAAIECVSNIQINLPDTAYQGGQEAIRNLLTNFDGMLSLWLPSRLDRGPVEDLLNTCLDGFHGYAVCESTPMRSALPAAEADGCIRAMSQLCLLRKPNTMAYAEWLATWMESHTSIAIACQSTLSYTQNVVQSPLAEDAPLVHGIVEECFPPEAYADIGLFFGAQNDKDALEKNLTRLLESTARFIPPDGLDRIFTARHEYSANTGKAGAIA